MGQPSGSRPLFLEHPTLGPLLLRRGFKHIFYHKRGVFCVAELHAVDHGRDVRVTSLQLLIMYESSN
jgi:hypothetical protein